jgi:hypothetical protein
VLENRPKKAKFKCYSNASRALKILGGIAADFPEA